MKSTARLEAPDGGWGILVCFGMAMPFVSGLAALPSFGLVFGDFLKGIGAETSAIGFITSAFFCSLSFAGLFSGSLFNRFGLRNVGIFGGALYFLGSVMQIFVTSTITLIVAFSIIQGAGFGLIIPTSYTTFNNYFVKKRVMWMSFAQSLIGLGSMFYPVLMQKLMEWYGFRGCLMVLAALNSHAVLGMLLMQPVEWHMRLVQVEEVELPDTNSRENGNETLCNKNCTEKDSEHDCEQSLLKNDLKKVPSRSSSVASIGNLSGSIVVCDGSPQAANSIRSHRTSAIGSSTKDISLDVTKRSICQKIIDFMDLTLLKKPIYVNIALGMSFALYSDVAFFTLQPLYMFELGFNKPDTATVIAIGAAADLVSRIFLAFLSVFIQMPSRYIYLAGAFFTLISRFGFLAASDVRGMAISTAIMGFLRTWIHVPLPLVFAEYLPKERFASGYGLFMFLQGNIMFAIGPVVGWLRDKTQDYILTFHCLNFFMGLCAFPWILEILFIAYRRRSKTNAVCETDNC